MRARILLLPGDGVGPEVVAEGRRALVAVARLYGHRFVLVEGLLGLMALDAAGTALPEDSLAACRVCDAALVGAVAGPADGAAQAGLRQLCLGCALHSNLMPLRIPPARHRHAGVDLLLVRDRAGVGGWGGPELAAGSVQPDHQLLRVIRAAFREVVQRRGRLTAVDPVAGEPDRSHWLSLVARVAEGFPEIAVEHVDLESCSRRLLDQPASLDVILACGPGLDRLHRRAAELAGSTGLLPSATLGDGTFGIYEPAHGAAVAIAGSRRANPAATLLSVALLLRHSLELTAEARALERAVGETLAAGRRTADLAEDPADTVTTGEFTDAVLRRLEDGAERAHGRA